MIFYLFNKKFFYKNIMDSYLIKIIICPTCKKKLYYNNESQELICNIDNLAFPIKKGIPVLMLSEARVII